MKISHKEKVQWRKQQVQQLLAKGHYSHREIAGILQIPKSTVSKDILTLREEAKNSIRKYIDERLPEEYERILVGVTSILREAWETSRKEEINTKEKLSALVLAKDCHSMKLDLLTNASVIDDAARFVSFHDQENKVTKNVISESIVTQQEEESNTTTQVEDTTNKVF
jgi:DNA-binding MarR family transcriptional regulator